MIFVGLGNPGKKYARTRHNLGARMVEAWVEEHKDAEVLLPQPGVFMNDFGSIVPQNKDLLIVHDDIELPFGEIKFQAGGSAKGHKGVRSIHNALGTTDVPRLRLGIGRPPEGFQVDDFVLDRFTEEEEEKLGEMMERATSYLTRLTPRNLVQE